MQVLVLSFHVHKLTSDDQTFWYEAGNAPISRTVNQYIVDISHQHIGLLLLSLSLAASEANSGSEKKNQVPKKLRFWQYQVLIPNKLQTQAYLNRQSASLQSLFSTLILAHKPSYTFI